ncbi:MAG: M50 family metallopeptidase [Polyangiaceae bacterium]
MRYVVAIFGLALLMVVHEAGHYFAARACGMRVTKFSIGFGPSFIKVVPENGFWWLTAFGDRIKAKLFKHNPEKHGPTVFQVAAIPFLAYVQIAGMNPLEEVDPLDKGSYANAGLWARIVTIFAGPLANFVFASVFFFVPGYFEGVPADETQIRVVKDMPVAKDSTDREPTPAAKAGLEDGDKILTVQDTPVSTWTEMASRISENPGTEIPIEVLRKGERVTIVVTPKASDDGRGRIGVTPFGLRPANGLGEAALFAIKAPPQHMRVQLEALREVFKGKEEAKLGGPKVMVDQMAQAAESGWEDFLMFLGALSTWLAVFNLLPIPALDGGRLMFLGYEATTRKRPNPTVEAHIHAIGLIMMLGLMAYVTIANDLGFGSK